ncbi:transporter, major facilitator family protein [Gleimia coleocanis DSM 15436]|uniref:Transporter, major facilitator family protein n=2 Tax=Gleimia TaxID=2692113 RepID=C0W257_9ACTO|nr:transporter, major facilitator family protein [Gleimia coleocanis DSM 15436]
MNALENKNWILATLLIPLAMSLIAVSSVNVALASIGKGLQTTDAQLQWVLSGYTLVVGVTLVPAGRLGDMYSRRTMFIFGLIAFVTGSFLSGLAPSALSLNAARVIQGVGAGMYSPQIMGMIQQFFQGRERAKAFGLLGMVVSFSVALGPVLAGAIISLAGFESGWRYIFFINLPLGIIGVIFGLKFLPAENTIPQERRQDLPIWLRLDFVGAALLLGAIVSLLIPFTFRTWHWWLPMLLVLAGALLIAWVKWESACQERGHAPMVDLSLLKIQSFSVGMATAAIYFMGATSMFVVMAMFVQNELGYSPLVAGVLGLPNAVLSAVGSRWGSLNVLNKGRKIVVLSLCVIVFGALLSLLVFAGIIYFKLSVWWLLLTLGIIGFGQGVFGSTNQTLAMDEVPAATGGTAGGLKQTTERIGTSIGSALMTGLYFTVSAVWAAGPAIMLVFAMAAVVVSLAALVAVFDMRRAALFPEGGE